MLRHKSPVFLFLLFLFCQLLVLESTQAAGVKNYSVVLASSPGKNLKWEPKTSHLFKGKTLYIEKTTVKGKPWERLCVGFYPSRKQALSVQKKMQTIYPGAWLKQSSRKDIYKTVTAGSSSSIKRNKISRHKNTRNKTRLTDKQLDSLMKRAKQDFTRKKYASAIRLLTALVEAGEHKYTRDALERLGLARQRNGQTEHAAQIYDQYLKKYPTGSASDRVRQRLAGLLTAAKGPRKKIQLQVVKEDQSEAFTSGNLSQFYRFNRATRDDTGSLTTLSQLISFLDIERLQRSGNYDQRYRFIADQTHDFIDTRDKDEFRFIETYYEISSRKTGNSAKIGRQALRIGGILKRFDGLSAGYQFTPNMRLNVLGGLPVDTENKTSFNKNKTFYGFTFETGTFLEHWDMNLFFFDQDIDGLNDRTSLGTELRYNDSRKSIFGMVDYDTFYKVVDILQFNANFLLDHGRTLYMNAFLRKAPILETSNALIGQPEQSIDELKQRLNIEQIYQLARDRTANSQTVTIGGSQPINEQFQASGDITLSKVGSTTTSGGVQATPDTGTDYFLSAQIVGNNLLLKRDTGVLGLRYNNTKPSNTLSLIANSRFPVTRDWRINPRLQLDYRQLTGGRTQKKYRFLLRTDYHYQNKVVFDFEIGYDATSDTNTNGETLGSNNLFFTLGYRWNF